MIPNGHCPYSIFSYYDLIFTPVNTKGSISLFYKPCGILGGFISILILAHVDGVVGVV